MTLLAASIRDRESEMEQGLRSRTPKDTLTLPAILFQASKQVNVSSVPLNIKDKDDDGGWMTGYY